MYFPDLSPYTYGPSPPHLIRDGADLKWADIPVLNVGWLGLEEATPVHLKMPSQELLDALWFLCLSDEGQKRKVNHMMGWHSCEFRSCRESGLPGRIPKDGLGCAEIRVVGKGVIYAAPDLIYHYVDEHWYGPPEPFVDAVLHAESGVVEVTIPLGRLP